MFVLQFSDGSFFKSMYERTALVTEAFWFPAKSAQNFANSREFAIVWI